MTDQEIINLYINDNKSTYEIAEIAHTYPNKIRRILLRHGVELKTKSDAQKNALKSGKSKIPTKGKARTKEDKLKISYSLQQSWQNLDTEEYQKRVQQAKIRWNNLSEQEKENMYSAAIRAIQLAGKEGSKLERFIRNELLKSGFKIEAHKKNLIPNENLEIDIYLPELKTIIEIDGPSHFLPIWGEEKLNKQMKADENKTGLILSKGMAIIRVKTLSDTTALNSQETLKNKLIDILERIKLNFPKQSERYIEIDI